MTKNVYSGLSQRASVTWIIGQIVDGGVINKKLYTGNYSGLLDKEKLIVNSRKDAIVQYSYDNDLFRRDYVFESDKPPLTPDSEISFYSELVDYDLSYDKDLYLIRRRRINYKTGARYRNIVQDKRTGRFIGSYGNNKIQIEAN